MLPEDLSAILPLPAEGRGSFAYWRQQIEAAEERRRVIKERHWDPALQSYLGLILKTMPETDTVVVPKDFANIERKKAELFFQNPEVRLKPKLPGLEDAVSVFQPVLNHKLGPDGVDAGALMTECVFDAIVTGLLVSKIGYESFSDGTIPIQTGEQPAGPATAQPGQILGLGAPPIQTMAPVLDQIPRVIHERYFWERISPARVLIPVDFHGFSYDKAPWLGYEFEEDLEEIRRQYQLPDDFDVSGGKEAARLEGTDPNLTTGRHRHDPKRVHGWWICYRTMLYDSTVKHPDRQRYLVILDGFDEPLRHQDSPYQKIDATGRMSGLKGYPVHIGALRYVSDTAYPPTEATIGHPQVEELSRSRTQMLLQRDRNVPWRWADPGRIGGQPTLDKMQRNIWQAIIPIPGADHNNLPIGEIPRSSYPQENFTFNSIIERDLNDVWAFSSNQLGQVTDERKTATEIRNVQANVSTRMDYERRQVIRFFIGGVEKLGSLIQTFSDEQEFVEIIGPEMDRRLQAWNKDTIAGEFVYDAQPDSSVRVDAAQEFRDLIEMYNLTARDPHANRVEILTKLARLRGLDPTRFVVPQLPAHPPKPPDISIGLKGEDLLPNNPHFQIVLELITQAGYKLSPEAIQAARQHAILQGQILNEGLAGTGVGPFQSPVASPLLAATHGGPALQAERVSKHSSERSTELSGPRTRPGE